MLSDHTGEDNSGLKNKMSQHKIIKKERRLEAIGMRKQGMTYAEIGRAMGVTRQAAYSYVEREFKSLMKEGSVVAEKALSLTLARFDELLKVYYKEATAGNRESLQSVLSIMDRQIKILGLEAPKKSESTVTYQTLSDQELIQQAGMWGISIPMDQLTVQPESLNDGNFPNHPDLLQ
jgi:predicted transcriptional regulator